MQESIYHLSIPSLLLALLPIIAVIAICLKWQIPIKKFVYVTVRMIIQLSLIGFALIYIFASQNVLLLCSILVVMFTVASWICLTPISEKRRQYFAYALVALMVGGGSTLILIIGGVIQLDPWYEPRYMIPLAGMIFANSMNGLRLAAERFEAEMKQQQDYFAARKIALQTAMLPISNSFLAVGLVALPGMMTGQILAGVSPLIAARYQIMVMSMLFGATGLTTAIYLTFIKRAWSPSQISI